jgi:hydrogenase nickel incorporation protein HypA/HybF
MHELSLALEVLGLVTSEAAKNRVKVIHEVQIEIGKISGVESGVFQTALEISARNSILDKARIIIINTPGMGKCIHCGEEFEMEDLLALCPNCQHQPSEITGGKELKVLSLTGE